jgi:hypothetical protein
MSRIVTVILIYHRHKSVYFIYMSNVGENKKNCPASRLTVTGLARFTVCKVRFCLCII